MSVQPRRHVRSHDEQRTRCRWNCFETADRSPDAQEDAPTAAPWPAVTQIVRDRSADLVRQWQRVAYSALRTEVQCSAGPIDVVEFEERNFTQAKAKPCKQEQNGVVATTDGSAAVDAGQHSVDLAGGYRPWK